VFCVHMVPEQHGTKWVMHETVITEKHMHGKPNRPSCDNDIGSLSTAGRNRSIGTGNRRLGVVILKNIRPVSMTNSQSLWRLAMSLDQPREALYSMFIPHIYPPGELERGRSVPFIIITTANTVISPRGNRECEIVDWLVPFSGVRVTCI